MTSKPEPDRRLLGAHDLALSALHEITPASTVGPAADYRAEDDGSVSLRFENRLPGYPGWYWTVTVARVEDAEPTVLELELLPGDGALLAPEWVPWAERLADYRAHQVELAAQAAAAEEGDASASADDDASDDELDDDDELEDDELEDDELEDDDDDEDDEDDDDLDEDDLAAVPRELHAGDLDGVDIDELDDSAADDDSDDDDESDDDESDEGASDDEE